MKKKNCFIVFFILSILIISVNFKFITASEDEDGDGIYDDFEEINQRNIEVSILEHEIGIESIRKRDENKFNRQDNDTGLDA